MKKRLFAFLLTSAIVLAQTGGGTTRAQEKTGAKSTTSGTKTKTKTKVAHEGPRKMSYFNEASHSLEATEKGGTAAPRTRESQATSKVGGCQGKQQSKKGSTSKGATGQSPTKTAQ